MLIPPSGAAIEEDASPLENYEQAEKLALEHEVSKMQHDSLDSKGTRHLVT